MTLSDHDSADDLEQVIRRAQAGDRDAFGVLLDRFESKALAIARGMGLTREDAQDAVQDAFLRLFRYIRRFRSGGSFTAWFYRIVVHTTYDHLRRNPRGVSLDHEGRRHAESLSDGAPAVGEQAEMRQVQERLLAALGCLGRQERAAFVLRELQGLDTPTVARAMRVSQVTVRRHAQNARRKLRERLAAQFPERFSRPQG